MKTRLCPKCTVEMQPTYEPYELRCPDCGFWFDTYTGKPISFFDEKPEIILNSGLTYEMVGYYLGDTIDMCYEPRMTVLIVGFNRERKWWLGRYIVPKGMDTYTTLTQAFLKYHFSRK